MEFQDPEIWENYVATEPCSPEPWKSWLDSKGNHPLLWPQYSG